jgi:hypothetical protein
MMKVRRAVVGTLAASVLVVGGLGVGSAWAQSDSSATPSLSQTESSGPTGSDTSSRADDCPLDGANGSDPRPAPRRSSRSGHVAGRMFWFLRKRFSGS